MRHGKRERGVKERAPAFQDNEIFLKMMCEIKEMNVVKRGLLGW
jgi:hypothetical protein